MLDSSREEKQAQEFASRLREALGDMSQADLIRLLAEDGVEIRQGRMSHYMQGRNYPDMPVLKAFAKALGVSSDWLLGLTAESLPVADLEEMAAKDESKINRIMRDLPEEKQSEVIQYAEYLVWRRKQARGTLKVDT